MKKRIIFSAVLFIAGINTSLACSCYSPPPPAASQTEAEWVAEATKYYASRADIIVRMRVEKETELSLKNETKQYRVLVRKVFKGEKIPKRLWLNVNFSSCSFFPHVGEEWILYANKDLVLNSCSGSIKLPEKPSGATNKNLASIKITVSVLRSLEN
ncbi:MAG: hypothetical protein ACREPB_04345 [Arenimonas sp.]